MYKLVYVPDSFHPSRPEASSWLGREIHGAWANLTHELDRLRHKTSTGRKTLTRRACFSVKGGVGSTIAPQTVLPNLVDFTYDSTGRCPHANEEHRHSKCELWKYTSSEGAKQNTYKMWIARDKATQEPIPVYYYMLGYDSLLGSHYDR